MKQHITVEQLEELSQPARLKLRKYMLKEWARPMKDRMGNWVRASIPTDDYQLSIGQMIEFLDEKKARTLWIESLSDWEDESQAVWDESENKRTIELCDWLWNAVKEILDA